MYTQPVSEGAFFGLWPPRTPNGSQWLGAPGGQSLKSPERLSLSWDLMANPWNGRWGLRISPVMSGPVATAAVPT